MATIALPKSSISVQRVLRWLPLVVLPVAAARMGRELPPWAGMWMLALSICAGLKWLTFADHGKEENASNPRALGYLLFWVGMDAKAFFS